MEAQLYQRTAAAYLRGIRAGTPENRARLQAVNENGLELFEKKFDELTEDETVDLLDVAQKNGFGLHPFLCNFRPALYEKLDSLFRGISPDNLLVVGPGRGGYLWHFLEYFRGISVTVTGTDARCLDRFRAVAAGGLANMKVVKARPADLSSLHTYDFDVVTALGLLDYSPDPAKLMYQICRPADRFVVISINPGADKNPKHLHNFSEDDLRALFREQQIHQVKIEQIGSSLLGVGRK